MGTLLLLLLLLMHVKMGGELLALQRPPTRRHSRPHRARRSVRRHWPRPRAHRAHCLPLSPLKLPAAAGVSPALHAAASTRRSITRWRKATPSGWGAHDELARGAGRCRRRRPLHQRARVRGRGHRRATCCSRLRAQLPGSRRPARGGHASWRAGACSEAASARAPTAAAASGASPTARPAAPLHPASSPAPCTRGSAAPSPIWTRVGWRWGRARSCGCSSCRQT